MRKRWITIFTIIFITVFVLVWADIPKKINIQGQLTDNNGSPLNGTYTTEFKIYTSGGTQVHSEATSILTVTNGIFNYPLGTNSNLTILFGSTDYWLGIKIGNDSEMTPRQQILSVGNAFKALNADTSSALVSAANIAGGYINDLRINSTIARIAGVNTWTGDSNTFNCALNVSTISNNSGTADMVIAPKNYSNLAVKLPKWRSLYITSQDNAYSIDTPRQDVFIGYATDTQLRYGTGYLNLLGYCPATSSSGPWSQSQKMTLYHCGNGYIETYAGAGGIYLNPLTHIVAKKNNTAFLPIGTMECDSSGTNDAYKITGTFGGSAIGGTVNFVNSSFRVTTNNRYGVHIQANGTVPCLSTISYKTTTGFNYMLLNYSGATVTSTVTTDWRIYYYE